MPEAGYTAVRSCIQFIRICALANLVGAGMAARLSADLGLHLDVTKHRNSGILTERDWKMRATTFWGVFILEVYASASPFGCSSLY